MFFEIFRLFEALPNLHEVKNRITVNLWFILRCSFSFDKWLCKGTFPQLFSSPWVPWHMQKVGLYFALHFLLFYENFKIEFCYEKPFLHIDTMKRRLCNNVELLWAIFWGLLLAFYLELKCLQTFIPCCCCIIISLSE